jgi:hypothetical protein
MAYWFQGIFAAVADEATSSAVCQEIHDLWPHARCRDIHAPFRGIGVSRTADAMNTHVEQRQLDEELQGWTPRFPDLTFVRVEAVCFGGACDYEGAVWRNGELVWREEGDDRGSAPLIALLRYLGVSSTDGYFEPFTRGYFAEEQS